MSGLPPATVLARIVETFFETIGTWFELLQYSSITVLLEDYDSISEEDAVLLHAITTATLRLASKELLNQHERAHQRELSMRKVKLYVLEHMSIRTLQALIILSIDAFGTDRMPGLLPLLRRQYDVLCSPSPSATPRSYPSTPSTIFDEQMLDASTIDVECLECLGSTLRTLEQLCVLTTMSRMQLMFEPPAITLGVLTPFSKIEQNETSTRASSALNLMSRVLDFGQVSFSSPRIATQKDWRRVYASLHQDLQSAQTPPRRVDSGVVELHGEPCRDEFTFKAIQLAATVYLHSVAIHMLIELGWTAKVAIEQWRNAITTLADALNDSLLEGSNPVLAFCLWIACRASLCHSNMFDMQIKLAVMSLGQSLHSTASSWSVAQFYAEQFDQSFSAIQARSLKVPIEPGEVERLSRTVSLGKTANTRADSVMQTPSSDGSCENDTTLFSCLDWAGFGE